MFPRIMYTFVLYMYIYIYVLCDLEKYIYIHIYIYILYIYIHIIYIYIVCSMEIDASSGDAALFLKYFCPTDTAESCCLGDVWPDVTWLDNSL